MFNWGKKKSVKELEAEILTANDQVVIERQQRIDAEIALSGRDATHSQALEEVRSARQVEVAGLQREIEVLKEDLDSGIESGVNNRIKELEKEAHQDRLNTRKELRAEFGTELDTLKKANRTLTDESSKNKGLYDGALLVIKTLEGQLAATNKVHQSLVDALPEVTAQITTPAVTIGSNNKVS